MNLLKRKIIATLMLLTTSSFIVWAGCESTPTDVPQEPVRTTPTTGGVATCSCEMVLQDTGNFLQTFIDTYYEYGIDEAELPIWIVRTQAVLDHIVECQSIQATSSQVDTQFEQVEGITAETG